MFIQSIFGWVLKLVKNFNKPITYGSNLEAYILSHNPHDPCDVDRLTREFEQKNHGSFYAG